MHVGMPKGGKTAAWCGPGPFIDCVVGSLACRRDRTATDLENEPLMGLEEYRPWIRQDI